MSDESAASSLVTKSLHAAIECYIQITEEKYDLMGQVERYKRLLRSISPHEVCFGISRDEEAVAAGMTASRLP